jgi:hypothetical protein
VLEFIGMKDKTARTDFLATPSIGMPCCYSLTRCVNSVEILQKLPGMDKIDPLLLDYICCLSKHHVLVISSLDDLK